jgi:hypothetical protein
MRLAGSKARKTANKINSSALPAFYFSPVFLFIAVSGHSSLYFKHYFGPDKTGIFDWFFSTFSAKRNKAVCPNAVLSWGTVLSFNPKSVTTSSKFKNR